MHTKSHFKYAALSALISCVVFCCVFISMCVTFPLTAHAQFEPPPGTPVPGCPAGSTNPNCAGTPGNTTPAGGGPGGANPGTGNPSGGYVPLEPLPFLGTTVDFANYLRAAFQILMIGGSILAVVMIVVGGVQYMTSDVLGTKEAGRERIKNAVFGLILLLCTYIILNTINPALTKFQIGLSSIGSNNLPLVVPTSPLNGVGTLVPGIDQIVTPVLCTPGNPFGACFTSAFPPYKAACEAAGGNVVRETWSSALFGTVAISYRLSCVQ